ncbi:hypothetical protein [Companilactobacillus ginsenosidimutans]|uniref:DUF559 domain-containing protein n=1 Tax=Companilactobacillus ginsenosidimutans TaxID=1007676 RepID=A0A0H4QLC7_9LACO|nr:hypothetical protein [Companilactobacillus ginsenosidimutans]AKP67498.1 hypothetical protein ABM34_08130 [Companilactobacillus ginsenosidimutans]
MSKGEDLVNSILIRKKISFVREKIFKDLKSPNDSSFLPVDFALDIGGSQAIVEYNGSQHYAPINKTPEAMDAWNRVSKNGQARILYCKQYNVPLLVIHYGDFERVEEILEKFILDVKDSKTGT